MKFLHTADWQIGMKAKGFGRAGPRLRRERLRAGERVVAAALDHGADFMLVAGDLFEDNAVDRALVQKVADILSGFDRSVFMIPGNHDPWVPGCVWEHPAWRSAERLHVLHEAQPLAIPGGLLLPCPVRDKYSTKDPTAWIHGKKQAEICIGMAHGNVGAPGVVAHELPIRRDAASRCNLDYLALGHWHSFASYPDVDGVARMAYAGTPETSRFGERDSGQALIVEIAAPGAAPTLQPVRTGRLSWQVVNRQLRTAGDLSRVRRELETQPNPQDTLLHLMLSGLLNAPELPELKHLEDLCQTRFLYARLDLTQVRPSPEDERWVEALPHGFLRAAAVRLREMAASGDNAQAPTASRALEVLCGIAGEVQR